MSQFFINRPIVAIVIAILTVIVGAVTITSLPTAQFPNIAPPEVQIQATYVGADAQTDRGDPAGQHRQQQAGKQNGPGMTAAEIDQTDEQSDQHKRKAPDNIGGPREDR